MLRKIAALMMTSVFIAGCSDPEITAPEIFADSEYSCEELVSGLASGDPARIGAVLNSPLRAMTQEYTEDYAIQRFYQNHVKNNFDYRYLLNQELKAVCSLDPRIGVNDAAAEAFTVLYSKMMREPRWATCAAYNDGLISMENIIKEIKSPTASVLNGDVVARSAAIVIGATEQGYGAPYLDKEVEAVCGMGPDKRIWVVLGEIALPIVDKLYMEEQDRIKEQGEKKAREERQKQRDLYSVNLYEAGNHTCYHFSQQRQLASDSGDEYEAFRVGLRATVEDIPRPKEEYLKVAFEEALAVDFDRVVSEVSAACEDGIADAVYYVTALQEAKSPYYQKLEKLLERKVASCYGECDREEAEAEAVKRAFANGVRCEDGRPTDADLCFEDPDDIFQNHLAVIELGVLNNKLLDAQSKRKRTHLDRGEEAHYMQPCKSRMMKLGQKDPIYYDEMDRVCPSEALEAYHQEIDAELAGISTGIKEREETLAELQLRVSNPPLRIRKQY